jgi:hypothetical protein
MPEKKTWSRQEAEKFADRKLRFIQETGGTERKLNIVFYCYELNFCFSSKYLSLCKISKDPDIHTYVRTYTQLCMCICLYVSYNVLFSSCNFISISFLAICPSYPYFRASVFTLNVKGICVYKTFMPVCRTTRCHNTGNDNLNKLFRTAGVTCLLCLCWLAFSILE